MGPAIEIRSNWSLVQIRNLLRREKISAIEHGDDFTAGEQLLQIVAIAELFVAKDAEPKPFGGNLILVLKSIKVAGMSNLKSEI